MSTNAMRSLAVPIIIARDLSKTTSETRDAMSEYCTAPGGFDESAG